MSRHHSSHSSSRKSSSRHRIIWGSLLSLIAVGILVFVTVNIRGCEKRTTALDLPQQPSSTDYGDLTDVITNSSLNSVVKDYEGMRLSFNPDLHIPNWVAWQLTDEETLGTVPRANKFAPDPEMKGSAESWDYTASEYDRGHMAPAGDMKWSRKAMTETFYMTNICPQAKILNAGSWKNLEEKCRQWALADGEIVIVCGPVIDNNPLGYIGQSKVYVPSGFFKVIISPSSRPMRGIGFIMPNGRPHGGLQACAVTIDSVEALTGHDFFSSLPDDLENSVESQCDFHYWSKHRPR